MEKLSALSFWQPYAWLIVNGHADVDSRTWAPTAYRIGTRIAIHASKKKMTREQYQEFLVMARDLKIKDYPKSPGAFEYGALVGTVELAGVIQNSKSYFAHRGYFHWQLKKPHKIEPIPIQGQRGWFKVEIETQ